MSVLNYTVLSESNWAGPIPSRAHPYVETIYLEVIDGGDPEWTHATVSLHWYDAAPGIARLALDVRPDDINDHLALLLPAVGQLRAGMTPCQVRELLDGLGYQDATVRDEPGVDDEDRCRSCGNHLNDDDRRWGAAKNGLCRECAVDKAGGLDSLLAGDEDSIERARRLAG